MDKICVEESKRIENMYIIVGLGNPTNKYDGTRHNIGFDCITKLAEQYNIALDFVKHKAICGTGYIQGQKVILAKPQTYMNLSGESVRQIMDYYKVSNEELIIIYDDISLDVGQLRIRKKGSAGGHNGIKSIIQHIGTTEFPRIKVGVGNKPEGWDLADYVLGKFSNEEQVTLVETKQRVAKACEMMLTEDIEAAMNMYNKKA